MDFSRFFIDRPIFAAVLSIVIFAAGLISIPLLPIGEYPEVVPPSVVVRRGSCAVRLRRRRSLTRRSSAVRSVGWVSSTMP